MGGLKPNNFYKNNVIMLLGPVNICSVDVGVIK